MVSDKFSKFIEIWQKEFAIERSIDQKVCVDKDNHPIPWYTYPAIEYLSQFDYRKKNIFEFGCGYSSIFWAERAANVVCIEDNEQWFNNWRVEFDKENISLKLREEGLSYYNSILEDEKQYDVIIIDGKCRAECAQTALLRLNPGGIIILDDSDRVNTSVEYVSAIKTLKNADLLQVDFYGFCPMNNYTKATSLFFSRDFDFPLIHDVQPVNGIGNLWGMKRKKRKEFYQANK